MYCHTLGCLSGVVMASRSSRFTVSLTLYFDYVIIGPVPIMDWTNITYPNLLQNPNESAKKMLFFHGSFYMVGTGMVP